MMIARVVAVDNAASVVNDDTTTDNEHCNNPEAKSKEKISDTHMKGDKKDDKVNENSTTYSSSSLASVALAKA